MRRITIAIVLTAALCGVPGCDSPTEPNAGEQDCGWVKVNGVQKKVCEGDLAWPKAI